MVMWLWVALAAAALLEAGSFVLLRFRLLPVALMRLAFTVSVAVCVLASWVGVCLIHCLSNVLHLIPTQRSDQLARRLCAFTLGTLLRPGMLHIRFVYAPGSLKWDDVAVPHAFCMTHTSFFDTLLYMRYVPYHVVAQTRTFAKASLFRLPLFGAVMRGCDHFPVYFTEERSDSFTVAKDKQAVVAERAEAFLRTGGSIAFFPEGAMNRTPEVLRDFRRGSFQMIVQHKLPIYYFVTCNNSEVWHPSLRGLPGYPADVYMYLGRYDYDRNITDPSVLASNLREEMQRRLNALIQLRTQHHYVPWYTYVDARSAASAKSN